MSDDVEQKAEQLARLAADRAAKLALADAEKTTALAVARAVKDANIDRDLADHSRHLADINGSQRKMAESLASVERTLERLAETGAALAEQGRARFSRRTLIVAAIAAVGGYAGLFAALISH